MVSHCLDSVADDAAAKNLTIHRDVASVAVAGDEVRLEQVVVNLLRNAIRYTPEGGNVYVSTEASDAPLTDEPDDESGSASVAGTAVLTVRDDGVGISDDDAAVIFEPFHQVRHHPFGSGGLGIGLTLVRQLVELHDGTVAVESDGENRGSTFRVRLPATAEPARTARSDDPEPSVQGLRILVVDDNADTCRSLAQLLEMQGNEVATAFDGADAIDTATAFEPRILLLDISLPDMTGYDVVRELRSRGALHGVDVVGISGFGHREAKERSHQAGIEHHLVKPVDFDALLVLLERLTRAD